jgi:hypothetical protein
MNALPLAFAAPWALMALITLPAIWWLLRFTPPRPREVLFPPLRLLLAIRKDEEKPKTSPWWLTALRLLLATLLILALAGPSWNPSATSGTGRGPLVVVLDDGWPAARGFDARRAAIDRLIEEAGRLQRPVMLVAVSQGADQPFRATNATEARDRLRGLRPSAFLPDRAEAIAPLRDAIRALPEPHLVWVSDGIANGNGEAFATALAEVVPANRITLFRDAALSPVILGVPTNGAEALVVPVLRTETAGLATGAIRALDQRGRSVAVQRFSFEGGAGETTARFEAPVEVRNDIFRLEVEDGTTAGGVQLLDDRFRRRTVGIVSGVSAEAETSPLLSPLFILGQALAPFADVREAIGQGTSQSIASLLDQRVSAILLADVAAIPREAHDRLERWLREGGVLIRFAGTRLAATQAQDPFIPVRLRLTARNLGGTLSWEQPQSIGRFAAGGPYAGMAVPRDVTVARQILAEPDPGITQKTWVELTDGTPLVTGEARGEGYVVLVHVTADPNWSNLPLSGTFLEMLRRTITLSAATAPTGEAGPARAAGPEPVLPPLRSLDAFGASGPPPAAAKPIPLSAFPRQEASRDHPPGVYGREEALRALNAVRAGQTFAALPANPFGAPVATLSFANREEIVLKPWLIVAALIVLLVDTLIVLLLAGGWRRVRRAAPAAAALALVIGAGSATAPPARAEAPVELAQTQGPIQLFPTPLRPQIRPGAPRPQRQGTVVQGAPITDPVDQFALQAANNTRLAFVVTGIAEIDEVSRAGLAGLSRILRDRTSLEPADPVGVDLARDELSFFPMIYWPVDPRAPRPSSEALARADQFMKNGGTILFDTRDQSEARVSPRGGFDTPGLVILREILAGIDVPELEPVPADHVMTKAFYIITTFPGRFDDGVLWTERTAPNPEGAERPVRLADGVSPILITTNDFAGAWALDGQGRAMLPMFGTTPRQQEFAFRAGVNIVLYLLTGNYKADQVHVPDILQRLGQ